MPETLARIERARDAGAVALIATFDWSFSRGRDWGSFRIPERLDFKEKLRWAPQGLMHPAWLLSFARELPNLTVPNLSAVGARSRTLFEAYGEWIQSPLPTWDDLQWLREQWNGPLMLKGVIRVDDAKRAVAAGVTAISVSNHGGNNLDGTPATIRALPAIADAVAAEVEVLLDGASAEAVTSSRHWLWVQGRS